jgi:hypothetical protein
VNTPPVRVRKCRTTLPLDCGHVAPIGSLTVSRVPGRFICGDCALALVRDKLAATSARDRRAARGTA